MLVRDLCGIFCFSMQFVIFMELLGTCVLPAAILFTVYLIVVTILVPTVSFIPLTLLAAVLGLPALLMILIAPIRRFTYLFWMALYLLSLPIWNMVLPAYAFWHFDDFSWGETRKVVGATSDDHYGDKEVRLFWARPICLLLILLKLEQGEFDHTKIVMRTWHEFERDRRRLAALNRQQGSVKSHTVAMMSDLVKDQH